MKKLTPIKQLLIGSPTRPTAKGLFFLFLLFYSCSSTKFVPEGDYLLDKIKIESDIPEYKTPDLRPYVRQQPNYKMFGINKTMFQVYNLAGRDTSKWYNRFIRKIGEKPVILDSTLVDKTNSEFRKLLVNKGYIHVDVSSAVIRKNKKADVIYTVKGNEPYRIRNYSVAIDDTLIHKELFGGVNNTPFQTVSGELASSRVSLIKENHLFDRNVLDSERERLTSLLRNRGYYSFKKDYFMYDADSISDAHAVDLQLKLRRRSAVNENPDSVSFQKYYFDRVYIYLDYDPLLIFDLRDYRQSDSIVMGKYTIYYRGKEPSLRPRVLFNNCFITPGRLYSQLREDLTYSSFSTLQALSNTQIQFEEKERNDSSFLDCHILTMPGKKQAVSFSVEGTNTTGDLGVASTVGYMHRNLFKGSEVFHLRLRGAYEALSKSNLNSY
ncbi:MAG: hypothetical protein LBH12_00745, partial [Dysgonamonadaceae bacterium]|nr:hypothetical protein [Dysgonamonadaceae bacterium]